MKCQDLFSRLVAFVVVATGVAVGASAARGEEEFERFLEALKRTQAYDEAQDYLQEMKESGLIPDELRETIPYEQGLVTMEQARVFRDNVKRLQKIEEARSRFEEFAEKNPKHSLAAMARTQVGNVLIERSRLLIDRSKRDEEAANKDKLLAEARTLLAEAQKVMEAAEAGFKEELQKFPKDKVDDPTIQEARQKARQNLIRSKLYTGRSYEEMASAYAKDSAEFKTWMTNAAKKYEEVSNNYRRWLAGLYAILYLGNCHLQLGDTVQALAYFEDLLSQPDSPELQSIKTKALRLAMIAWTSEKEKKFEAAGKAAANWLKAADERDKQTPEGLAIRWFMVVASDQYLAANPNADAKVKSKFLAEAQKNAQAVALSLGDHQKDARAWLQKNSNLALSDDPTSLQEAFKEAGAALKIFGTSTDPKQKAEMLAKAERLLALALTLRDESTKIEEVNFIRYYQAYVYHSGNRYWEAAVLADWLAKNYPKESTAKGATNLGFAAWATMCRLRPQDNAFETERMLADANLLTENWAGEKEADDAAVVILGHYAKEGKIDKALEFLKKIPDESPRRADAELRAGQALWNEYLALSTRPKEDRPSADVMKDLRTKIEATLKTGVERMKKAEGGAQGYPLLAAELSLAQYYLNIGDAEQSLALITREKGVVPLVEAGDAVTDRGNFRIEALKAALRGFVAVQKLDEAERTMGILEKLGGNQEALTRIYVTLGQNLQEQLESLRANNATEQADKVTKGFELFLRKIAERPGNSYGSLYWVANTYRNMGIALDAAGSGGSGAKGYFDRSADAFERLGSQLDKLESDEKKREDKLVAVQIRQCEMLRRAGTPEKAIPILLKMIAARPKSLEAQMEAAYAYQEMGKTDPASYVKAMMGAERGGPTKQNQVWGWRQLSETLRRIPNLKEMYVECTLNYLICRYQYGLSEKGAAKTKRVMGVKVDIERMHDFNAALLTEHWLPKYDLLYKQVNEELREKHVSLRVRKPQPPPPVVSTEAKKS